MIARPALEVAHPWVTKAAIDVTVVGIAGVAVAAMEPPVDISSWAQFIRDVGFPIFVAAYVLIRLDRTMLRLTRAIERFVRASRGKPSEELLFDEEDEK